MQLVRDEDHRAALGSHDAQGLKQRLGFLRREHRGRLVEDQHLRLAVERLQDLDALLLAKGQLPDPRPRIDRDPVSLAEFGDPPFDAPRVHHELLPLATMVAEHHVLSDGERGHEPEMLVHHPDPRVEGVARRRERDEASVKQDLSLVGAVEAGENVGEGRLACAVLSEQRVHLTGCRLELDAVVRNDPGKPLGDVAELDGGGHRKRAGGADSPARPSVLLALGAPDDALHEVGHRVEVLERRAMSLLDPELALLVVDRAARTRSTCRS